MRKVIVSLIVVLVAGAGGLLGFNFWAHYAVAREVDAMLDGWRASIGSATRGRVELDLWTRTVRVTDVVVQPRSAPHPKITVARIVASGVGLSGKPAQLHLHDVQLSETMPGQPAATVTYKAASISLKDFSARPLPPRKVANAIDVMHLWLELASATTATLIEAPSLTVTMAPGGWTTTDLAGNRLPPGAFEITYTNLFVRNLREGRIAEAGADGAALRAGVAGPARELAGGIGKIAVADADVAPMLAVLDPTRPKGQGYQRVYRKISMGPYSLRALDGTTVSVDRIVAEDVGLRPDRRLLDDFLFLSEVAAVPGPVRSPSQMTMLLDKVAGLYEGVRVGRLEMQGMAVKSAGARVNLAALRIERLENGRLGELSFDGLDARPPVGDPVSFGRIALKGFDIATFMRVMGSELSQPSGQPPSFERLAAMQSVLEGFEFKGIAVPDPLTGRKAQIDASVASANVVGKVPTEVRASLKVSAPIHAPNPEPFINLLVAAGFSTLVAEAELGMRWNEAAQTLALEPATLDIGGFMTLSVKASIGNASRGLFSTDMMKAMEAAFAVEAGPIEVTLRDRGMVDILAANVARSIGQPPEAGRRLLLEQWTVGAQMQAQLHPGAQPLYEAIGRFLEGKGETLTVRLTPRARVRLMTLIEALRLAPPEGALLGAFTVEASSAK